MSIAPAAVRSKRGAAAQKPENLPQAVSVNSSGTSSGRTRRFMSGLRAAARDAGLPGREVRGLECFADKEFKEQGAEEQAQRYGQKAAHGLRADAHGGAAAQPVARDGGGGHGQGQQPEYLAGQHKADGGGEVGAEVDDLGRGRGLNEPHANDEMQGKNDEAARSRAVKAVVHADEQTDQRREQPEAGAAVTMRLWDMSFLGSRVAAMPTGRRQTRILPSTALSNRREMWAPMPEPSRAKATPTSDSRHWMR